MNLLVKDDRDKKKLNRLKYFIPKQNINKHLIL